jgi:putative inorganic carbon (HCO3(-)) transporter
LLAILFILPIPLGANRPWAWNVLEITIFVLTLFVIIKRWKVEKLGVTSYVSAVCLWLGFIFLCALQIIPLPNFVVALLSPTSFDFFYSISADFYYLSIDPSQSRVSFIKLLSFFCLFVCVLALVNSEQRIRLLLLTIIASGTFQALYGIFEIFSGANSSLIFNLPIQDSATGSFVLKSHYANFLMLTLCAAIGLLVASLEKNSKSLSKEFIRSFTQTALVSKVIVPICIAIMVAGLVMSGSKMGNITFFAAVVIVGAIAFILIKNISKGLTIFIISMFVLDLLIVSTYFGLERVKERLAQPEPVQETQEEVVTAVYPVISDFPLFGSGGGSFHSTFPNYESVDIATLSDNIHNDYLQFLAEYGVIGSFILFSIFVFSLYKCLRAMHKRRNSIFKGSAYACLMVFVGMGLHMTVDFPLQSYANASYFVVFLALSMIINSLKIRRPSNSTRKA